MSVLMGIAATTEANVYTAGQEAARQMLAHLGGPAHLTLVFSSIRFADPKMLAGVRSVTNGAPLIGCTDAGGISTWGPMRKALVVIGLRGTDAGFVTGVAHGISRDPEAAGRQLAADLKAGEPGTIRAALMFPDGLAMNNSAVLRGVQKGLGGDVPIVGGCAGDDFYFQRTFQYFDEDVLTDSVPGVLLHGELAVGVGVRHGWVPLGRPRRVTRAQGPVIQELDGEPAADVYQRCLGFSPRSRVPKPLAHLAMAYPLGGPTDHHGECLLRSPVRIGERQSLVCTGEFAEGAWVRLMIGGSESVLAAASAAAAAASRTVGDSRFKGALIFSSAGRQRLLGAETQGEIDIIRDSLGGVGVRLGGFYGYGEQAPVDGTNMFHNDSVVVMTLG